MDNNTNSYVRIHRFLIFYLDAFISDPRKNSPDLLKTVEKIRDEASDLANLLKEYGKTGKTE